jgi:hypothetical protein
MTRISLAITLLGLAACTADPDGDGLTNRDEKDLGTDPERADSDEDGLTDAEEADAGTDPLAADSDGDRLEDGDELDAGTDPLTSDTDGDGYDDRDEVVAGTDPLDADDVVYAGGWPFNADKHLLVDPGLGGGIAVGDRLPRRTGRDQFGEIVDLYDFAGEGVPVVIDISALWCAPCQGMAIWLEEGEDPAPDIFGFDRYANVQAAVDSGELRWITVMSQGAGSGSIADQSTVDEWATSFPQPNIPVVTDRYQALTVWSQTAAFPSLMLLDEDLNILSWDPADWNAGLAATSELLRED